MYIILTVKNTSANCKAAEQAVDDLRDEYGYFEGLQRVASVDGGLIVYIIDVPHTLLYQEDVQRIVGSINVLVVGG